MQDRAEKVRELFDRALDRSEAERAPFVAAACAGDEALQAEVLGLLAALEQASGFLTAGPAPPAGEGPGAMIGRYRLLDRLGEGGFGVVFRAEQQEPMRRDVALKVIKLGMDTRAVVARFERERQALARMQHPHIAAVFDGGTTPAGRPYFVMELVAGDPITRFCSQHGLGIEERVALVRQVCLAVQHAHNKGVVHRDLKPGNILVSAAADGSPAPKVIDFGIAKAIDPDDGPLDTFTGTRHGEPIGTLEYMAPEQTGGGDIDSRADVYALGVVLYELLTGRRPFERDDEAGDKLAMLQRIRADTAVRPSTCVSGGQVPLPLPGADRQRWARQLRGGVDWVLGRALAKEPARRYQTPAALAEDLQRFLEGLPVEAGPPTATYQLRCFVARHRLAVGAAALVVLSLIGGVVGISAALADAQEQARRRQRTLAAMRGLLLAADPGLQKGPDYSVRQMLDDFAAELDRRFAADDEVASELHLTIGGAYRNLGQLPQAERHVARALELARAGAGGPAREQVLLEWAWVMRELGRYGEAGAAVDEALAATRGRPQPDLATVRSLLAKADLHRLLGEAALGEPLAREALAILDLAGGGVDWRDHRAAGLDLLGVFADARGDAAGALSLHQDALELRQASMGKDHPVLAVSWTNIAVAHKALGALDAAESAAAQALRLQRQALGERHPALARTLSLLGDLALQRRRLDEAERFYEQAQDVRSRSLPDGHLDLATGLVDRARIALARKRDDRAEALYREALAIREAAGAPLDHAHAALLQNLGVALRGQGRHAEGEAVSRRALEIHRRVSGDSNPTVADCLQNIALALVEQGRAAEGMAVHEEALALRQRHRPDDLVRQKASCAGLAAAAVAAGDLRAAARAHVRRAELMLRSGEDPRRIASVRMLAGRLFLDAGEQGAATPVVETVYAFCVEHMADSWARGEAASLLSACRAAVARWDDAVALAEEGWEHLENSPAPADRKQRALRSLVLAHEGAAAAGDEAAAARHRAAAEAARRHLAPDDAGGPAAGR